MRLAVGGTRPGRRALLVCIDYEGTWGIQREVEYDLAFGTEAILGVLARHGVRATFFIVGELAVQHPDLVAAISRAGHEVAIHGWRHENLATLDVTGLPAVSDGLREAEDAVRSVTGTAPVGFRAPYLLAPLHYRTEVQAMLAAHGYRWTSNREIRQPVILAKPDSLGTERVWRGLEGHPGVLGWRGVRALGAAFNARPLHSDPALGSWPAVARWLARGAPPFFRGDLLEVPVHGPLDCHLVGLPDPLTSTPEPVLRYAAFALRETLARDDPTTMLTFHDWLITGGNRLSLLDGALQAAADLGLPSATVSEHWLSHIRQADGEPSNAAISA